MPFKMSYIIVQNVCTLSIFQMILFHMWDVTGAYSHVLHQHQWVSKAQVPEEGSLL